jgi:hypothetical protein
LVESCPLVLLLYSHSFKRLNHVGDESAACSKNFPDRRTTERLQWGGNPASAIRVSNGQLAPKDPMGVWLATRALGE